MYVSINKLLVSQIALFYAEYVTTSSTWFLIKLTEKKNCIDTIFYT